MFHGAFCRENGGYEPEPLSRRAQALLRNLLGAGSADQWYPKPPYVGLRQTCSEIGTIPVLPGQILYIGSASQGELPRRTSLLTIPGMELCSFHLRMEGDVNAAVLTELRFDSASSPCSTLINDCERPPGFVEWVRPRDKIVLRSLRTGKELSFEVVRLEALQ